ncbi:MAG: hypothetical protein ACRD02_11915 [Acidimicrobiia bacterium]
MGQLIRVASVPMGDLAVFDTDRSITGQDGHEYGSLEEARAGQTFPSELAARLFEADGEVGHVYVLFNQVVVRRSGPWEEEALEGAAEVIRTFFVFYEQNKHKEPEEATTPALEAEQEE